jgi:hypothetical protein
VRSRAETMSALADVGASQVRDAFAGMLGAGAAVAVTGKLPRGTDGNLRQWTAPLQGHSRPSRAALL